jgi:hypothetical protein
MKTLRAWLPVGITLVILLAPLAVNAQIVPQCGITQEGNPNSAVGCNLCHLGELMQNIINFLILGFAVPLAAAMFAYAGILYTTAGSNTSRITKAHKIFKNVLIGFLIAISGWLVINTILTVAFDKSFFNGREWFQIQCVSKITDSPEGGGRIIGTSMSDLLKVIFFEADAPVVEVPKGGEAPTVICPPNSEYVPSSGQCVSSTGTPVDPIGYTPIDNSFTYDAGIEAQVPHASVPLANLLNCMATKLPGNVGRISSISDSNITRGTKTWAQCRAGQCNHVANSLHYGGSSCGDRSYAVDFGDQENAFRIINAAYECKATNAAVHNGNHVHVSISGCGSVDIGD